MSWNPKNNSRAELSFILDQNKTSIQSFFIKVGILLWYTTNLQKCKKKIHGFQKFEFLKAEQNSNFIKSLQMTQPPQCSPMGPHYSYSKCTLKVFSLKSFRVFRHMNQKHCIKSLKPDGAPPDFGGAHYVIYRI